MRVRLGVAALPSNMAASAKARLRGFEPEERIVGMDLDGVGVDFIGLPDQFVQFGTRRRGTLDPARNIRGAAQGNASRDETGLIFAIRTSLRAL